MTTNSSNSHADGCSSIVQSDARDFLMTLEDDTATIVFLDPPFNLGKKYQLSEDATSIEDAGEEEYEQYLVEVLTECIRVLEPGGSLYMYHLPYWASRFSALLHSHLDFRHWIAVSMKNGFARGDYLYPAHYALLYFTKGTPKHFTRPKMDPPTCRSCGEFIKDYGGYREIIEREGINLGDVWEDLSPVRHGAYKLRSANQLPQDLTDRVVAISGVPGGLLVDPFVGTGTSLVSAIEAGMVYQAADLSPEAVSVATKRSGEAAANVANGGS